ncbi:TonB-dependent receptor plug domain-containing protein [Sphingobium chungbukense]|uniref:TonB-dependent receptor n=1 Tax=Sphingobium chungbukense TaxID=56193 RepID=A0A0M3ANB0_9SPHN|nr:TonB-dependent receptor [Sphingobium chungbukense]KKW90019.1 TonB-dependent receptor [Sphingobium chungbukense]
MRIRRALAGFALATCLVSPTQILAATQMDATLSQRHKFDIAPQPLSSALRQLSTQSGVRILFPYDEVAAIRSRGIQGWLSTQDALERLLAGTALKHSEAGVGVIALAVPSNRSAARRSPMAVQFAQASLAGTQPVAMAPAAEAEDASAPIIVTGTRQTTRTVAESLAPIDVLSVKDLEASGKQSVRDLLGTLVPSINVSNNGAGASWAVRTLSLRGLGGDQLLVLVNGKRRHNTATLFINGSVQNGQSPPDLDLIPGNSIQRIEVLRDGASAQYGSDAIAGVVNIILKNDTSGGAALTMGSTADNGGWQGRWQVDKGFALGDGGYIHLSADGVLQDNTMVESSPIAGTFYPTGDPRNASPNRIRAKYGQPQVIGGNVSYDAMLPIGESTELYSFGTYSKRHAAGWLTYRLPSAVNNILEVYPDGYIPRIHVYDEDFQVAAGIRGDGPAGIHYDLSTTYAEDEVKYSHTTSLNASLGPASPTHFYLGKVRSNEWTTNLDLQKEFEVGLAEPLFLAVGGEYRRNSFLIGPGDPVSYIDGGYRSPAGSWRAGELRTAGSQGVTGFLPSGSGKWSRNNWSAYINLEQKIIEGFEIGLAGRHEDYSDFGTTDTGKVSARIEPVKGFALRGTASTGFRAPTLQQQHYASSSTIGVPVNGVNVLLPVQALPVGSPAAVALGAVPLKPEKSTNFSAGVVLTPVHNLNITVDAYQIKIRDRIMLSETLSGTMVRNVLAAAGIPGVAGGFYFVNAADTRTRGLDIVSTYRTGLGDMGSLTASLSANFNKTIFTHIDPIPNVLAGSGLVLVGRAKQGDFTKGTPRNKFIGNLLWDWGAFSANLRATRYGKITQVASGMVLHDATNTACTAGSTGCTLGYVDEEVKPKVIFDLEMGYKLTQGVKLSVGANNLFNIYPTKLNPVNRVVGSLYNAYAPYGISGGYYYGRLNLEF